MFITKDIDLFLPRDPSNLARAWGACERAALELWLGEEPLDHPRDNWLAQRIIERRALTRAAGPQELLLARATLLVAARDSPGLLHALVRISPRPSENADLAST